MPHPMPGGRDPNHCLLHTLILPPAAPGELHQYVSGGEGRVKWELPDPGYPRFSRKDFVVTSPLPLPSLAAPRPRADSESSRLSRVLGQKSGPAKIREEEAEMMPSGWPAGWLPRARKGVGQRQSQHGPQHLPSWLGPSHC